MLELPIHMPAVDEGWMLPCTEEALPTFNQIGI